jgi:hypothetical protein
MSFQIHELSQIRFAHQAVIPGSQSSPAGVNNLLFSVKLLHTIVMAGEFTRISQSVSQTVSQS